MSVDAIGGLDDLSEWLTNEKVGLVQRELEERILQLLFSHEVDSLGFFQMAAQLAWIGARPEERPKLLREIVQVKVSLDGTVEPCKHWAVKKCNAVGHFFVDHTWEIAGGVALVATGASLVAATGYALSVCVGGVVVAGAGSIWTSNEDKSNPHIPNVAPPSSKQEIAALQQTLMPYVPQLNLSSTPTDILVTPEGIWAGGQFYSNELLNQSHFSELFPQIYPSLAQAPPFIGNLNPSKPSSPSPEYLSNLNAPQSSQEGASSLSSKPVGEPTSAQQFVQFIEGKLQEPKDPNYIADLLRKDIHPSPGQEFASVIEGKLLDAYDPAYTATLEAIRHRFMPTTVATILDNYASTLASNKPTAPFHEVPLLGYPEQSTIHFHCGISNTFSSIVKGGLRLNDSLNNAYAVQPHLIHGRSISKGLSFVGLEKANETFSTAGPNLTLPLPTELTGLLLDHSQIQRSIDYEVEHLSRIAKNIREKDNPKLKQVHVTFSNGGYVFREALKRLSPEDRETIVVITAGTTAIIEDGLAFKVRNIIGDKDWPSKVCNGGDKGIEEAKSRATIEIISQTESEIGLGGHYFMQPDYQREVSRFIADKIRGEYEIY